MAERKPVIPRVLAVADVEAAVAFYVHDGGRDVALSFIEALDGAYDHIARHSATGSLRNALELDIPGLRFWRVAGFPYLVFYLDRDDHIDVWRVLHGQRDIPTWLRESAT